MNLFFVFIVIFIQTLCFTPRSRCSSNRLTFTKRYTAFHLNAQRTQTLYAKYDQFFDHNNYKVYHYGYSKKSQINGCFNFFASGTSCCDTKDISIMQNHLLSIYKQLYQNAKYPSFQQLYNTYEVFPVTCNINASKQFYLPNINNKTYATATPQLSIIIQEHDNLMDKIRTHQINFIKNSVCVFCLGTKDYSNILSPTAFSVTNEQYFEFAFNELYFKSKVKQLANILVRLFELHQQILPIFAKYATNMNCTLYKTRFQNLTYWNSWVPCTEFTSCQRFVIDYFGDIGAPQLLRQFGIIANSGKLPYRSPMSLSKEGGYKGNQSYPLRNQSLRDIKRYTDYQVLLNDINILS